MENAQIFFLHPIAFTQASPWGLSILNGLAHFYYPITWCYINTYKLQFTHQFFWHRHTSVGNVLASAMKATCISPKNTNAVFFLVWTINHWIVICTHLQVTTNCFSKWMQQIVFFRRVLKKLVFPPWIIANTPGCLKKPFKKLWVSW